MTTTTATPTTGATTLSKVDTTATTKTTTGEVGRKSLTGSSNCPYAASISDDEEHSERSAGSLGSTKKCPAFEFSCPFKEAKSAEDIKQKLLELPPSHLEKSGQFFKVIQNLHNNLPQQLANNTDGSDPLTNNNKESGMITNFSLPGGCPMQGYYQQVLQQQNQNQNSTFSFHNAIEDCSFSAIMARMAKDLMGDDEDSNDEDEQQQQQRQTEITPKIDENKEEKKATGDGDKNENTTTTTAAAKMTTSRSNTNLAEALKTGTEVSHKQAEDVDFVSNFIRGKINREKFKLLVLSLFYIYETLENCLKEQAEQFFPTCYHPELLDRTDALKEDLDFWWGTADTSTLPQPTTATKDYMDRLLYIKNNNPLLLLSHSYTRYLGDLSGGKILARVARKALQLSKPTAGSGNNSDGLAFYEFENIKSPKKFKDEYRTALDSLPLDAQQIQLLVAEANVAFCLNIRIFQELSTVGTKVMPLQDALAYADITAHTTSHTATRGKVDDDAVKKCPFIVSKKDNNKENDTKIPSSTTEILQHVEQQQQMDIAGIKKKGQCPWPFILLHDPKKGMENIKTWIIIGLILSYLWSQYIKVSKSAY